MSKKKQGQEIASPKGNLGVLLVGLGAVSTTFIAGVEAIKKGKGSPHWLLDPDGDDPSWEEDRAHRPPNLRFCSSSEHGQTRFRSLGYF